MAFVLILLHRRNTYSKYLVKKFTYDGRCRSTMAADLDIEEVMAAADILQLQLR